MKNYFKTIALIMLLSIFSCSKDDDAPSSTNTAPEISAQSFNASEAVASGNSFGTVAATDDDGDTLTYSITTNDNGLFSISSTGALSVTSGNSLDYETVTSHIITVTVSDGELSTSADMTINVIDEAENVAPVIADQTFTTAEDIDDNVVIGTVTASDADGDALTYSITINPDDLFEINQSGEISLASGKNLDFETTTSHTLTIQAADGDASTPATITIEVTDVDEAIAGTITVSTFAGSTQGDANGVGTAAQFGSVSDIIVGPGGDLYIADAVNNTIRKIEMSTATVTKFSGTGNAAHNFGSAAASSFNFVSGIVYSSYLGRFFVADTGNHLITQMATTGNTSFWAGTDRGYVDGNGTGAKFNNPTKVTADASGNLYAVDRLNNNIRKITPQKVVSTFAGSNDALAINRDGFVDGVGTAAKFDSPISITIDTAGNLYVVDQGNNSIRKITANGVVTTLAGSSTAGYADGAGTAARFNNPNGIAIDADGNLYVADVGNHRIRKITPTGIVTTVAGTSVQGMSNGDANIATFNTPFSIAIDADGNLYVGDQDATQQVIRKITFN